MAAASEAFIAVLAAVVALLVVGPVPWSRGAGKALDTPHNRTRARSATDVDAHALAWRNCSYGLTAARTRTHTHIHTGAARGTESPCALSARI